MWTPAWSCSSPSCAGSPWPWCSPCSSSLPSSSPPVSFGWVVWLGVGNWHKQKKIYARSKENTIALVFSLLRLFAVLISTCVVGMSYMIRGGVWMSDIGINRRGSGDQLYWDDVMIGINRKRSRDEQSGADFMLGINRKGGYREDAHCETLALLADALLVFDQLVDEWLKHWSNSRTIQNPWMFWKNQQSTTPAYSVRTISYTTLEYSLGINNPQLLNILGEPPDAWQWPPHTPASVLPAFAWTRAQAACHTSYNLQISMGLGHAEKCELE